MGSKGMNIPTIKEFVLEELIHHPGKADLFAACSWKARLGCGTDYLDFLSDGYDAELDVPIFV
jgi:hypothetical protein